MKLLGDGWSAKIGSIHLLAQVCAPIKTTRNSLTAWPRKSVGENSDEGDELRYASDTKMLQGARDGFSTRMSAAELQKEGHHYRSKGAPPHTCKGRWKSRH